MSNLVHQVRHVDTRTFEIGRRYVIEAAEGQYDTVVVEGRFDGITVADPWNDYKFMFLVERVLADTRTGPGVFTGPFPIALPIERGWAWVESDILNWIELDG